MFARELYDGLTPVGLPNRIIELSGGRIVAVRPAKAAEGDDPAMVSADVVAAGFIDLQINGASGAQFNFDPSVAALELMAHGARRASGWHGAYPADLHQCTAGGIPQSP